MLQTEVLWIRIQNVESVHSALRRSASLMSFAGCEREADFNAQHF